MPYANLISIVACIGNKDKTRLVVSEHLTVVGERRAKLSEKLKWFLRRRLYGRCSSIVAVSQGVADDLRCELNDEIGRKISVIHNPCFIPGAYDAFGGGQSGSRNILAVGRLCDDKGHDVLIRAFSKVKDVHSDATLIIAGEGPARGILEDLIEEIGLKESVKLFGFTKNLHGLYREADLFVCSSRREGFGNVLVEAMSFGLPIVSTDCPHGPGEILESGRYGSMVPVDDVDALAAAMIDTLSSYHDPAPLIARAREFSLKIIGDQYLSQIGIENTGRSSLLIHTEIQE